MFLGELILSFFASLPQKQYNQLSVLHQSARFTVYRKSYYMVQIFDITADF